MADAEAFWDGIAEKYAKRPIKAVETYEKTLERTLAYLSPGDRVLEVGCGTGSTALRVAPAVGEMVASDLSARMIEIAREKAAAEGVRNLRFDHATVFDEQLEPGRFDAVLAFNLLHLVPDIPSAARRIHALLKPGGLFVSKTVCLAEQTRLWRLALAVMKPLGFAPDVRCMKVAELEGEIVQAGFEIVETGNYPASPPSRFIVARRV